MLIVARQPARRQRRSQRQRRAKSAWRQASRPVAVLSVTKVARHAGTAGWQACAWRQAMRDLQPPWRP
eukprot:6023591-Alexandrium_andersonii.AAC.1